MDDKFERFEVLDRHNARFGLTDARWQRFGKLLKQYEGWASALQAQLRTRHGRLRRGGGILDEHIDRRRGPARFTRATESDGHPFATTIVSRE